MSLIEFMAKKPPLVVPSKKGSPEFYEKYVEMLKGEINGYEAVKGGFYYRISSGQFDNLSKTEKQTIYQVSRQLYNTIWHKNLPPHLIPSDLKS